MAMMRRMGRDDRGNDGVNLADDWVGRTRFLLSIALVWCPAVLYPQLGGDPYWASDGEIRFERFLLACSLAATLYLIRRRRMAVRRSNRIERGLCPSCGYDLRSSPTRCPECGKNAAEKR